MLYIGGVGLRGLLVLLGCLEGAGCRGERWTTQTLIVADRNKSCDKGEEGGGAEGWGQE